jgi:hypothetical protein
MALTRREVNVNGIELIKDGCEIIGFHISAKHGGYGFDVSLSDLVNAEGGTQRRRDSLRKLYQDYLRDIVKTWEQ